MDGAFIPKLEKRWAGKNFLCVGLDPDIEKIPESMRSGNSVAETMFRFNREIIDATADLACAFKPQSAFYEAYGEEGYVALKRTAAYLAEAYPEMPTILDAKRGDIGNTNEKYAEAVFDELGFGAVTLHPYLGRESAEPFLTRKDRGVFVLVKTSNPGSGEFQDLPVEGEKLYERVARAVANDWNRNGNCGVVAGATYPEELSRVREVVGSIPILVPGIGAQGGDAKTSFDRAKNATSSGVLISASRSILYASAGVDFAEAARAEAERLSHSIIGNA